MGVLTKFLEVVTKLRAHFYVPAIPTKKIKLEFADIDEVYVFLFMHLVVRVFCVEYRQHMGWSICVVVEHARFEM